MKSCQICGVPFPPNTPGSKKYCSKCLIKHNREASRERRARRAAKRAAEKQAAMAVNTTEKEDRVYCSKCVYSAVRSDTYLCDYISLTGTRRGCKPGKGCTKREMRA